MVIAWGLPPMKELLNTVGQVQFEFPGIHNVIIDKNGKALPHIYKLNYLSASGTAILFAALIAIPLVGLSYREGFRTFIATLKQLRFAILTIASVLAFAYIMNDSGITISIAEALTATGLLFPFFSPMLGWLGVFITGSDTSSNALFGKLQASTANSLGLDPVVTVSANVSGGVVGKMISPSSIAVAATAGDLAGKESMLFRFTVKHSFIMLAFICLIVLAQAYLFKWIIPSYQLATGNATVPTVVGTWGYVYLIALLALLLVFSIAVILVNRKGKILHN